MQDVNSHGRVVDSVIEKAQTLLHSSQNQDVSQFIKETKAKYTSLQNMARDAITRSEQHVSDHSLYTESYNGASDWLRLMNDRLAMCADMSGDKHSVTNKLDRVQVRRSYMGIVSFLIEVVFHLSPRKRMASYKIYVSFYLGFDKLTE